MFLKFASFTLIYPFNSLLGSLKKYVRTRKRHGIFCFQGTGESDSTADTSFTEEDFQTFLSSQATEDVKDTSFCEEDFSRFLDMESSYTEEDWKSFLDARKDEDDEFMCDIEEQV